MIGRVLRVAGRLLASLLVLLSAAWVVMALHYQLAPWGWARHALGALWVAAALAAVVLMWRGRAPRALLSYGAALAMLLGGWWAQVPASDTRDWAEDVSRHLIAQVDGEVVTLQNVRNFDWRSNTDFTPRWDTRRYDLRQLRSTDMAVSYWMGPAIAHTLVSFGFDDGRGGTDYVAFSVEIRKERHDSFSAVAGFFKQFELALVAADERDVLRVRTNVRGEDVYLYRVDMPPAAMRSLFLAYVDQARGLSAKPRFYDTLTANCTTIVFEMAQRIVGQLPLDWRLLASGYLPEYLHSIDGLKAKDDLATLRAAGRIAERAKAADQDADFSQAIRRGIPGMDTGAP